MSDDKSHAPVAPAPSRHRAPSPPSARRTVLWWALVGVLATAFTGYLMARYLLSAGVHLSLGTEGQRDMATFPLARLWFYQAACTAAFLGLTVFVLRDCRRQRRMTVNASMYLGFTVAFWVAPLESWRAPFVRQNPAMIHATGSWGQYIPGWNDNFSQPLIESAFVSWPTIYAVGGVWVVFTVVGTKYVFLRPWPHLSGLRLALAAFASVTVIGFAAETLFIYCGGYAFDAPYLPGMDSHWYQFPVIAALGNALTWGLLPTVVLYHHHRKGPDGTVVLRGLGRLPMRLQPWAQTFALIGFIALTTGILHTVFFWLASLTGPTPYADTSPYPMTL
ncbi:spirocyclase AveC family protein [Streptomyces spectabilis]|uniref:spirocyclase AveC family protein n=1 Tax=Streptomyces spectabilis TaxID=68270 RepID=UPI003405F140